MTDPELEAMARVHCDYFGGKGWWDTGLIADTKPKAFEAMGLVRQALDAHRIARAGESSEKLHALRREWDLRWTGQFVENALCTLDQAAATITSLEAENARLREALRACRRATLHNASEPRHNVREIVDQALKGPEK